MHLDNESFPVIFGQNEGETVLHEFELPIDYNDEAYIEIVTISGFDSGNITDNYTEHDFVFMDKLSLFDNVVSTEEPFLNEFKIFPNPSSSVFTFQSQTDESFNLTIFDNIGRTIRTMQDVQLQTSWDASGFDSGIYFYTIEEENGQVKNGKLIVQR